METKNIRTPFIVALLLFLLTGFVLVGSIDISAANDRKQADNDAQQRIPPLESMHWSRYSVRKPTKKEQRKAQWRKAKCSRSKTLGHFLNATKPGGRNGEGGTEPQRTAQKKLGLKSPLNRANDITKAIYRSCHKHGADSIQSVLNLETEAILKHETKQLKDHTYRVDYLLHCFLNLGRAQKSFFKKTLKDMKNRKSIERDLTIKVAHVVRALEAHKDMLSNAGLVLEVKPYLKNNQPAITPILWGQLYQFTKRAPIKLAAEAEVSKNFDSTTYDSVKENYTAEALAAGANDNLELWVNLYSTDVKAAVNAVPEPLQEYVSKYRDKGNQVKALNQRDAATDEDFSELETLSESFVTAYVKYKQTEMPDRESLLRPVVEKAIKSALHAARTNFHSWEIRVARKLPNGETEVTLQWHLSHMSEYKAKGQKANGFAKNDHTGARYLLGPSNFVRVPDDVRNGYHAALLNTSAGKRSDNMYGDAVSMSLIPNGGRTDMFFVKKDLNNQGVEKVRRCRTHNADLYTMINVGLGNDPSQPAHLVMGLYTDPDLVQSEGQMTAPVLKTIAVQKSKSKAPKPKKSQSKKGPNTAKNIRKVEAVRAQAPVETASKDDMKKWMSPANAEPEPDNRIMPGVVAQSYPFAAESHKKDELLALCAAADLPRSGNKAELSERLRVAYEEAYGPGANQLQPAKRRPKKESRKGKTPPIAHRKNTGNSDKKD
jgi:hypothetical protein